MVTFTSQVLKFLLQIGSTAVLARLLVPADFGLVAMVTAITGFMVIFKEMGLSVATVQRPEITHGEVSNLFWVNTGMGAGVMLLTMLLAPLIARFYQDPRLVGITLLSAVGYLFGGLSVQHQALLRRKFRFSTLAAIDFGALLAGNVVAVGLALAGAGYWSLLALSLGRAAVETGCMWAMSGWKPSLPLRKANIRPLLSFGAHLTVADVLGYLSNNVDKLLLGRLFGPVQLGYYNRAQNVIAVPLEQLTGPLNAVGIPVLSRVADDPPRYRRAFLGIFRLVAFLLPPCVVFLMVGADWLVRILLGDQWQAAVPLFAAFGLVAFTKPIASVCIWTFATQGRTRELVKWTALNACFVLAAVIAGMPWGALGVAVAYSVSGVLLRTPVLFWFAGKRSIVTTKDFYRTALPFTLIGWAVLGLTAAARQLMTIAHPLGGLLALAGSIVILYGLGVALWPATRQSAEKTYSFLRAALAGRPLPLEELAPPNAGEPRT